MGVFGRDGRRAMDAHDDEYWVPEHVREWLRSLGFTLPLEDMVIWLMWLMWLDVAILNWTHR